MAVQEIEKKTTEPTEEGFGDKTYSDAVDGGHYDLYRGGLEGKHDNVRTYWEDQIRGIRMRPHLVSLVNRKRKAGEKLRIADLGCGTGEGCRLLTSWNRDEADFHVDRSKVIPLDMIEAYLGADLCQAMVDQGNMNFTDEEQVRFRQGDFSDGFPLKDEDPFDLYFCTYASFSHIDDEAMERLLTEIAEHVGERAVVAGEWLGRHSIEWPCYWDLPGDEMLDYTMSYIPGCMGGDEEPEHFPMRYWIGDEIRALAARVAKKTKTRIRFLDLYDCSVFTGRHVDTNEYNEWVPNMRATINQLHEQNVRTDLGSLRMEYVPTPDHDELNGFFTTLQYGWNTVIDYCERRLQKRVHPMEMKNWKRLAAPVQLALLTLDRVIDAAYWIEMGDPRANLIEPQLGYALRGIEMEMQEGRGCGHTLVGVMDIRK